MKIEFTNLDEKEIELIKKQLNTEKVNILGIASRCFYKCPSIVIINPIDKTHSLNFSNLANPLWLSCPYLNERIHNLEDYGYIKKISEFIRNDRQYVQKMEDAHAHFYFFRKGIYKQFVNDEYPEEMIPFFNAGIGGIKTTEYLKCLHVHYSHFQFCSHNIAGMITAKLLKHDFNCPDKRCLKYK